MAKKHAWRWLLLALGCVFLAASIRDIDNGAGSVYMLVAALGCFIVLGKSLLSKGLGTSGGHADDLVAAICIAAGEVAHAEKNDISEEELSAVVACVQRIPEATARKHDEIVAEFYRLSSLPWMASVARNVETLHRFVVLQSAIDVASKSPTFSQAQTEAIKRIGIDLGFETGTVEELLRANKNYKGERHQQARAKKNFEGDTKVPGTIAHALGVMELPPTATWKEVKRQYKHLAMQYHPDRAQEKDKVAVTEKFKQLGDAYKLLKGQMDKAAS